MLEIKNVKSISNSDQFRAQLQYARDNDLPLNLIVSPRTERISQPLLDQITAINRNYTQATGHTAGGVYRFNPATNDLTDF